MYRLRYYNWVDANTDQEVLNVRISVHALLLTYVRDAIKCKDEGWVEPFFHITLLKDFGSLASWISVMLHESSNCCCLLFHNLSWYYGCLISV